MRHEKQTLPPQKNRKNHAGGPAFPGCLTILMAGTAGFAFQD